MNYGSRRKWRRIIWLTGEPKGNPVLSQATEKCIDYRKRNASRVPLRCKSEEGSAWHLYDRDDDIVKKNILLDADYFLQHSHNCCLVNLEDMLNNGTVISKTLIEKPHMFSTACNIATQVVAQVASCQFGGQTITMSHLAPFVQCSREKFTQQYLDMKSAMGEEAYVTFIERMVRDDIKRGVQTIQYQVVTLMTTNGQAPFITVYLDINEVPEGQTRDDLALVIREVLEQRYEGVKNEQGVWITPAFPKIIYALDENNIAPGTDYWYLTKLAAKCTAKRMVPDYISRKLMKELKIDKNGNGNVHPCIKHPVPYIGDDIRKSA